MLTALLQLSLVLQVFTQLEALETVSLHLVEISPLLSKIQERKLCNTESITSNELTEITSKYTKMGRSKYGVPVYWYNRIEDVPEGFSLYIAHEFFDALPIHKFQVCLVLIEFNNCLLM